MKPVAVHVITKEKFVSADKHYDLECKSTGSRPEAVISWWKGGRQIKRMAKNVRDLSNHFARLIPIPIVGLSAVLRDRQSIVERLDIHAQCGR